MGRFTKKVMILFDPEQYLRLEQEAKRRKSSVGALVREAVDKLISAEERASREARIKAGERLLSVREKLGNWEEIEKLIGRGHTRR